MNYEKECLNGQYFTSYKNTFKIVADKRSFNNTDKEAILDYRNNTIKYIKSLNNVLEVENYGKKYKIITDIEYEKCFTLGAGIKNNDMYLLYDLVSAIESTNYVQNIKYFHIFNRTYLN